MSAARAWWAAEFRAPLDHRGYILLVAMIGGAFSLGLGLLSGDGGLGGSAAGLALVAGAALAAFVAFRWSAKPVDPELLLELEGQRDAQRIFGPKEFDHEWASCPRSERTVARWSKTWPDCRTKLVDDPSS